MKFRSGFGFAGLGAIALVSYPAVAQDSDSKAPEVFKNVMDCRAITQSAERLACFDSAVDALAKAQETKDVLIVTSEEARKTRRGLFGFVLPSLGIFGGGEEDADEVEEIKEITAVVESFSGSTGRYVFKLDDGAVWEQSDGAYLNKPKAGKQIVIRRAALGSYMARLDGGVAFRIKRRN